MSETVEPEFTKQDYLDLLKTDRVAGLTQLSQLLFDAKCWEFERELGEGETGTSDETHMVEDYFIDANNIKRCQYVLKPNPNAALYQLGFTEDEIKQLLEANA